MAFASDCSKFAPVGVSPNRYIPNEVLGMICMATDMEDLFTLRQVSKCTQEQTEERFMEANFTTRREVMDHDGLRELIRITEHKSEFRGVVANHYLHQMMHITFAGCHDTQDIVMPETVTLLTRALSNIAEMHRPMIVGVHGHPYRDQSSDLPAIVMDNLAAAINNVSLSVKCVCLDFDTNLLNWYEDSDVDEGFSSLLAHEGLTIKQDRDIIIRWTSGGNDTRSFYYNHIDSRLTLWDSHGCDNPCPGLDRIDGAGIHYQYGSLIRVLGTGLVKTLRIADSIIDAAMLIINIDHLAPNLKHLQLSHVEFHNGYGHWTEFLERITLLPLESFECSDLVAATPSGTIMDYEPLNFFGQDKVNAGVRRLLERIRAEDERESINLSIPVGTSLSTGQDPEMHDDTRSSPPQTDSEDQHVFRWDKFPPASGWGTPSAAESDQEDAWMNNESNLLDMWMDAIDEETHVSDGFSSWDSKVDWNDQNLPQLDTSST